MNIKHLAIAALYRHCQLQLLTPIQMNLTMKQRLARLEERTLPLKRAELAEQRAAKLENALNKIRRLITIYHKL